MKIDWKRKLTSRKFWAAMIAFVTALLFAFGVGESDVTKVTGVIMAGATAIAYIIGEGMVDAKSTNIKPQTNPEIIYDDDEYEDEDEEGDCDDE